MRSLFLFILSLILLCCVACVIFGLYNYFSTRNPEFGKEFNPQRIQMGIPVIPEKWTLRDVLGKRITWGFPEYPPSDVPPLPRHSRKQIVIVDENTIEETDFYNGTTMVTTLIGDHLYDSLSISCVYHLDNLNDVTCTATFHTGDNSIPKTREEAILILEEWGISYP
jgi:hypothetical protein